MRSSRQHHSDRQLSFGNHPRSQFCFLSRICYIKPANKVRSVAVRCKVGAFLTPCSRKKITWVWTLPINTKSVMFEYLFSVGQLTGGCLHIGFGLDGLALTKASHLSFFHLYINLCYGKKRTLAAHPNYDAHEQRLWLSVPLLLYPTLMFLTVISLEQRLSFCAKSMLRLNWTQIAKGPSPHYCKSDRDTESTDALAQWHYSFGALIDTIFPMK